MTTFWLQVVLTLCSGAFGALAWMAGTRPDPAGPFRAAAWRLTGVAFGAHAAARAAIHPLQLAAIVGGEGSDAWELALLWQPVANHGRAIMLIGFGGLLAWLLVRRDPPGARFWAGVGPALAGGMAAGGLAGHAEGVLSAGRHYPDAAFFDLVQLCVLFAALLAGLFTSRMDRLLWGALAAYALTLVLNVVYLAALGGKDAPGAWTPPAWGLPAYRAALAAAMAAFAWRRVTLARRGKRVPALLESPGHPSMFPS